jgi:hypothetical protein
MEVGGMFLLTILIPTVKNKCSLHDKITLEKTFYPVIASNTPHPEVNFA